MLKLFYINLIHVHVLTGLNLHNYVPRKVLFQTKLGVFNMWGCWGGGVKYYKLGKNLQPDP